MIDITAIFSGFSVGAISISAPWILLLTLLPLLIRRLKPGAMGGAALHIPESVGHVFTVAGGGSQGRSQGTLTLLIWLLLVFALSGPRLLAPSSALPVSGRDLVLALDLSGSMVQEDFTLNGEPIQRLDAVKRVAARFVRGRGGDRVALVIFASEPFFATPQTHDVEAVALAIEASTIGIAGRATGISAGLGLALKRLGPVDAASKVIILLSDGANNTGPVRPRDAARLAGEMGVRIHTIALGPLALGEEGAGRGGVDAATLAAIADLSGGQTFRVRNMADLEAVADAINQLEATVGAGPETLLYRQLWPWPAGIALALAGLFALRETRR